MKGRTHSCARSESVLRYHNKRHERCAGRHRLLVRLALQPERQTTQQQLKERDTWPRSKAIQGANAAIQFATLATGLAPDNRDFVVI